MPPAATPAPFRPDVAPCGSKMADGMARGAIIGIAWGAVFDTFAPPGAALMDAHVPHGRSPRARPSPRVAADPSAPTGIDTHALESKVAASTTTDAAGSEVKSGLRHLLGRSRAVVSSMGRSSLGFGLFLGIFNGVVSSQWPLPAPTRRGYSNPTSLLASERANAH